jgi:hypothetical protein
VQKSFILLGKSLPNCLGCQYCRLSDGSTDGMDLKVIPGDVNPVFRRLPVAVNLLYGDPTLQPEYTATLLRRLAASHHSGPVVIILKGDFSSLSNEHYDLDLHYAFSTFGLDHPLDGGSRAQFLMNLSEASRRACKFSIEFRPIIYGINDDRDTLSWVLDRAAEYNVAVGYSGLQGKPSVVSKWDKQGLLDIIRPVPGFKFGHKKIVASDAELMLQAMAQKRGVPLFRKTSCLVSYTHGLARDYNAHYYKPTEVGCATCPMQKRCALFKAAVTARVATVLPYEHQVVYKNAHECILKRKGVCEFPTDDCSNISGNIIKTNVQLTTADVRVTKWLTGMTVDADFVENPYLNDFWTTT